MFLLFILLRPKSFSNVKGGGLFFCNVLWRIDTLLGNARNTHAANNTAAVFSVARLRTVAMQRTLNTYSHTRWRHTIGCVFCCGPCRVFKKDKRGVMWLSLCPVLVTDQWTRSLTRDTCFLRGPCRVYIPRVCSYWTRELKLENWVSSGGSAVQSDWTRNGKKTS
jgi:hypothetical protein